MSGIFPIIFSKKVWVVLWKKNHVLKYILKAFTWWNILTWHPVGQKNQIRLDTVRVNSNTHIWSSKESSINHRACYKEKFLLFSWSCDLFLIECFRCRIMARANQVWWNYNDVCLVFTLSTRLVGFVKCSLTETSVHITWWHIAPALGHIIPIQVKPVINEWRVLG